MDPTFKKTLKFLKNHYPDNIIMPTVFKNPKYRHKDGQWTWKSVYEKSSELGPKKNGAILLKTFIVLDFDDIELAVEYENKFSILTTCPMTQTKKGRHYYFLRNPLCDTYALYDHSRCFGTNNDMIDFKTICSTGTAGVVIIPPSKDKKWVRPLWDHNIPIFDGDILEYFNSKWIDKKYRNSSENFRGDSGDEMKVLDTDIGEEYFDKTEITDDKFREIIKYIDALNVTRATSYNTWIEMLWCLKNISTGFIDKDKDFMRIWLRWSKQCKDKYDKEKSKKLWKKCIPRKNGLNIGTLVRWAKHDNPENLEYGNISDNDKSVISYFIRSHFYHSDSKIKDMVFKDYDDKKFIFIDLDEKFCKIYGKEHDKSGLYIVIGSNQTQEKCRICDKNFEKNIIQYRDYPKDMKDMIDESLITEITPEKTLKTFCSAIDDPEIKKMNHDYSPRIDSVLGPYFNINNNKHCPLHPNYREGCNNCAHISHKGRYVVSCGLSPLQFYPPLGINVPDDKLKIIIGTVNVNNTTNNNYYNGDSSHYLLLQDYENDNLPFFNDEPNKYRLLLESFGGKHNDVSRLVHEIWKDDFRYIPNSWYRFENHIWSELTVPVLRDRLSGEFCKIYKDVLSYYRDNEHLDNSLDKIKQIDSLIANLKISHFKNSVMEECREIYQVTNMDFNKNVNCANVLPFNNGVLELDTLVFRDGLSSDNMITTTGIDYIPYNPEDAVMNEIQTFFDDVLPNHEVREYFIKICALCLTKNTQLQKMWILTGGGSNGKSLVLGLLNKTLGKFSFTIKPELLTRKSEKTNEANDAVSSLEFVRHLIINEPGSKEIILAEKVKMICGGKDKITVRGLFQKQKEYLPEFKTMLICNSIPLLSEDNHAIWRRIRIIDFPVCFNENPDPDDPFQKKIDETLESRIDQWAPYFAGYLKHWLEIIYREGGFNKIKEPHAVQKTTKEYQEENDQWKEFIEDKLIRDENSFLLWNQVKEPFMDWVKKRFNTIIRIKDAKEYLIKKIGPWIHTTTADNKNKDGFKGWNFKPDDDDFLD
jgi:P4 family phage/plasmid primase-like protien